MPLELEPFLKTHPPGSDLQKADPKLVKKYEGKLPSALLELWAQVGFGSYGGGLIRLVDPNVFKDFLKTWLGKEHKGRYAIAIGSFGDVYYYRVHEDGVNDVSRISTHTNKIQVITGSVPVFFNEFFCDAKIMDKVLRCKLHQSAVKKFGEPCMDEMFCFVPALVLGGDDKIGNVRKVKMAEQLDLLHQMQND